MVHIVHTHFRGSRTEYYTAQTELEKETGVLLVQ